MKEKIVGIIGGMGPEATVDLMSRVLKATPAADDIDHIRMVVDNNPKVPSRIKALLENNGEPPAPCLQDMAVKLADWGVDLLAMPCNTAHCYFQEIQNAVDIPLLNMIELSVRSVLKKHPDLKEAGILASTAVLNLGLYKEEFQRHGLALLSPDDHLQGSIMDSIRRIKTGRYGAEDRHALRLAADDLQRKGAEAILIACTELSVIANEITGSHVVDTAQVLAEGIVSQVKGSKQ